MEYVFETLKKAIGTTICGALAVILPTLEQIDVVVRIIGGIGVAAGGLFGSLSLYYDWRRKRKAWKERQWFDDNDLKRKNRD